MNVQPVFYNSAKWIEENQKDFDPPVCNKMMHGEGQMKCFYVGGPNIRKDYHLEEGPEFFYMVKGDMCLKIMEQNKPKDVVIKQGEVFFLPPRIPHAPQRSANTVGLVIERERLSHETDCLRYYVMTGDVVTSEPLYEKWFHCQNLGPQLSAAINEYFQTEQFKTGKPLPGTISSYEDAPVKIDVTSTVNAPFSLEAWLDSATDFIDRQGSHDLFTDSGKNAFIKVYGMGEWNLKVEKAEVFIWILRDEAVVEAGGHKYQMQAHDTLWVPANADIKMTVSVQKARLLVVYMEPPQQA